ncbi:hypothetical protein SCHPADRAFT_1000507 [Schizopora paradoxa]|uniref:Uncharacterized protein n=1 Tax=Schizopora paradoxa TaxID=27342 RepID=A0A0H2RB33_9AGAM|nr:hypothetical protein SCHPADRAFT_1000507 [Schizopora paradoxa]
MENPVRGRKAYRFTNSWNVAVQSREQAQDMTDTSTIDVPVEDAKAQKDINSEDNRRKRPASPQGSDDSSDRDNDGGELLRQPKRFRTDDGPAQEREGKSDSVRKDVAAKKKAPNNQTNTGNKSQRLVSTEKKTVDLPLVQWYWDNMRCTDEPVPHLAYYVRICTKTSKLELVEQFGPTYKVLKSKCLLDIQTAYSVQECVTHFGRGQSEAYVHLEDKKLYVDNITLKFSKYRNPKDYDFLMAAIRPAPKT